MNIVNQATVHVDSEAFSSELDVELSPFELEMVSGGAASVNDI